MAIYRMKKNKHFTTISNRTLQDRALSLKARGLLTLMLSLPEDWEYSAEGLARICKEGVDAINTILKELEQQGYLVRGSRLRREDGTYGSIRFDIYENPRKQDSSSTSVQPVQEEPARENPRQAEPVRETPGQIKNKSQKTKEQKDLSIHLSTKEEPEMVDGYEELVEQVRENVEYEHLLELYDQERVDGAVGLIVDTLACQQEQVQIGKRSYPYALVRDRLLSLNELHLQYVFDSIDQCKSKVRDIRAYLLSSLFNAPNTMEEYYRTRVNHEVFGGQPSERMAC